MKHMEHSFYHKALRVCGLTLALVLLFDSGLLGATTAQLSNSGQQYMANVIGVGAAVAPTELNQLTAALTEQQRDLDKRAATLAEREIAVGLNTATDGSASSIDFSTYLLSTLLFIIIVLLVLNYALDFARERHLRELTLKTE